MRLQELLPSAFVLLERSPSQSWTSGLTVDSMHDIVAPH